MSRRVVQFPRMARFDILTIGSATQDVFLRSSALEEHHDDEAPDGIAACFLMGSKMPIEELTFATGGGATNAAVTFGRRGFRTACLTRVGKDEVGRHVLADLKREKVDVSFIQHDAKAKTAYSVILLSGAGHRAIFNHRGASRNLDLKGFPWNHWTKKIGRGKIANWIYLTTLGEDMRALKDVFTHTARSRTKIAWNPGNKELERGLKTLAPFIKQTDVFSLNREEAATLAHIEPQDTKAILKALGDLPRAAFLLTDGQHGAYVRANRKTLFAPALAAKRVNATGAGDAFGSGFVASWIKKQDSRTALAAALLNATGVITHMGAKAGILKRAPNERELKRVKIR